MPVAIRAWDGSKWVPPRYNVGTKEEPKWREYSSPAPFVPHMNDTFGGNGDWEWVDTESATTPEGDGYIYGERSGLNWLIDGLQQPPALSNVGKLGRIQVAVRAEALAGTMSLVGCYFKFEVRDAFLLAEEGDPENPAFGNIIYEYQTGEFPDTIDTGWVMYEPPGMYEVRAGVPEFHRVELRGPTEEVTTRLSLSRWTVIDTATDRLMGYQPVSPSEMVPRFWDGTTWVEQTMA